MIKSLPVILLTYRFNNHCSSNDIKSFLDEGRVQIKSQRHEERDDK